MRQASNTKRSAVRPSVDLSSYPDARVRAVYGVLSRWLPREVAAERTRNAVTPLLLVESLHGRVHVPNMDPRHCFTAALRNAFSMRGYVASREAIEAAVAAWVGAEATA